MGVRTEDAEPIMTDFAEIATNAQHASSLSAPEDNKHKDAGLGFVCSHAIFSNER